LSRVLAERALVRHPDFPCPAADEVAVRLTAEGEGRFLIEYVVIGRIADLVVPPPAVPARGQALWRHTCFELFVAEDGQPGYIEYNFAPSSLWAAYGFDGYRSGMRDLNQETPPQVKLERDAQRLAATVTLKLGADARIGADCRIGLSTIIEGRDGVRSFWALAHPPGTADFHHPACFALQVSPAACR